MRIDKLDMKRAPYPMSILAWWLNIT